MQTVKQEGYRQMKDSKIVVKGIIRRGDEYLLVKKWYDDRIDEPYQWEFIDGYAEIGDSPDDAVNQIVSDKTYLLVQNKRILYTWSYQVGDTGYVGLAYLCEVDSDIVILSEELQEYRWVKLEEFPDYITNHAILRDVQRVLGTE